MPEKFLIVIDMQHDFVSAALGSSEAAAIVPAVVRKMESFQGQVLLTQDSHKKDYLDTQEGRLLPVRHCIEGSAGWQLVPEVERVRQALQAKVYRKPGFGSLELVQDLMRINAEKGIASIELVGLCTDICVVCNALAIKGALPEVPMSVDAACCAGTSPQRHHAALETMRSCQILVEGE